MGLFSDIHEQGFFEKSLHATIISWLRKEEELI